MNNTLNVAVATDTILYAPFYLALYGGDFEDTPFGQLDINIIGQKGDMFFKSDGLPSEAVDGFVTLALFFEYADIGICDPSFILDLYTTENFELALKSSLESFIKSLLPREKIAFYERFKNLFNNKKPHYTKIEDKFKEKFSIKVVGGLIQKSAFLTVGKKTANKTGFIGTPFLKPEKATLSFDEIVSLPLPSTGFYFGKSIIDNNDISKHKKISSGKELDYILKSDENSIALSCDFVSIDYYQDKLKIYDDYVNNSKNTMFTGIIANFYNNNKEKYKAFLYGIEKNLFNIDKYLNNNSDNDLSIFFKNKLLLSKSKHYKSEKDLISFLVSDINVENELIYKEIIENYKDKNGKEQKRRVIREKDKKELIKIIDDLIYSYVQRLYKWKRNNRFLYYASIKSEIKDLQEIYRIRTNKIINLKTFKYKKFHNFNLLNKWRKQDKTITKRHKGLIWRLITNDSFILLFASIFVAIETIGVYTKFFHIPPIINKEEAEKVAKDIFGVNIHYIIIVLFALIIILIYLKSHKYIKFNKNKKYVFDLDRKIPRTFFLVLNKIKNFFYKK